MSAPTLSALAPEYFRLFASCVPAPGRLRELDATIRRILRGRDRYEYVAQRTPKRIPWVVIGLLHLRECDLDFTAHLHNGDPLAARTVHVPKHRPPTPGPWTWETSAMDALKWDRLDQVVEWDVAAILFNLERFNGFGYRARGLRSPYLWGASNHQQPGKFVADGVFLPDARDLQPGAATLLHRMCTTRAVALQALPREGTPS